MRASRLAAIMRERDLTVTQLARKTGFARGTITNMLLGRHSNATEDTYRRLAPGLNMPTADLFRELEGADDPDSTETSAA